jgi:hypothetical protein
MPAWMLAFGQFLDDLCKFRVDFLAVHIPNLIDYESSIAERDRRAQRKAPHQDQCLRKKAPPKISAGS